jgi:hypothetical protein
MGLCIGIFQSIPSLIFTNTYVAVRWLRYSIAMPPGAFLALVGWIPICSKIRMPVDFDLVLRPFLIDMPARDMSQAEHGNLSRFEAMWSQCLALRSTGVPRWYAQQENPIVTHELYAVLNNRASFADQYSKYLLQIIIKIISSHRWKLWATGTHNFRGNTFPCANSPGSLHSAIGDATQR